MGARSPAAAAVLAAAAATLLLCAGCSHSREIDRPSYSYGYDYAKAQIADGTSRVHTLDQCRHQADVAASSGRIASRSDAELGCADASGGRGRRVPQAAADAALDADRRPADRPTRHGA